MPTCYRLIPEGPSIDLDLERFRQSLPPSIQIVQANDGLYASVESETTEDPNSQGLIDRELDRIFFVTYVRLRAEMCRRTVSTDFAV